MPLALCVLCWSGHCGLSSLLRPHLKILLEYKATHTRFMRCRLRTDVRWPDLCSPDHPLLIPNLGLDYTVVIYTSKRSKRRLAATMCLHFGPAVFPLHSQKTYLLWLHLVLVLLAWCHCLLNLFNLVLIYNVRHHLVTFLFVIVFNHIIISTWHLILLWWNSFSQLCSTASNSHMSKDCFLFPQPV